MTDLDDEDIATQVNKHVFSKPDPITETQKTVAWARAHAMLGTDEESDTIIEKLADLVEELDKAFTELTDLYNKSMESASNMGWELENRREEYYQNNRETW